MERKWKELIYMSSVRIEYFVVLIVGDECKW